MSLREQDGKKVLDLDPNKVKTYLKYLTEGCLATDKNGEGSERRFIWDYLNQRYDEDQINYRDFLLAFRRFIIDGKMINNDGFYQMHPAVIEEVKKKTPTPAIKKIQSNENIHKSQKDKKQYQRKGSKDSGRGQRDGSVDEEQKIISRHDVSGRSGSQNKNKSSKISSSGKKQKVKPRQESTRQSTIYKYYMKRQMNQIKNLEEFDQSKNQQNRGLGFTTPAPPEDSKYDTESDEEPILQYRDDTEDEDEGIAMTQSKLGFHTQQQSSSKGRGKKNQLLFSQKVEKKTKAISKGTQRSQIKDKKSQKTTKETKQQKSKKSQSLSQDILFSSQENNTTSETENRHPIHFLTQPVEQDHQRGRSAQKQKKCSKLSHKFLDQQQKPQQRSRSKKSEKQLDSSTIKALKLAVQNKNIRFRKQQNVARPVTRSMSQESTSQRTFRKIQKKPQFIKKTKIIRKLTKPTKMRLRGKTLDLTKLGVISKPKVKVVEKIIPKRKNTKYAKPASKGVTPRKSRKDSVDSYDHILSQRSDRKNQHSNDKYSQIYTQKTSTKKSHAKPRQSSKPRSAKKTYQEPGAGSRVQISNIIYYDRKAKIDAAKNLKQLYTMHSTRDGLVVDEKLIYL